MKKIIVSGFGGQGVLSLGLFLSYSAMNMNYNTSWLPSYGPEMRGGTANVSVTYSRYEIACPLISKPDFLVAFNEPSLTKFLNDVRPGGTVLVNSSIVEHKAEKEGVNIYYIPVDDLAKEINPKGGNIIMLGAMLPLLKTLSYDAAVNAVKQVFKAKPQFIDSNIACLNKGVSYIEEILKEVI